MKNYIKKIPGFNFINLIRNKANNQFEMYRLFNYDLNRFSRFYTPITANNNDQKGAEGWILQDKHRIEKGLSLPSPRPNFGVQVIERLVNNLSEYSSTYSKDYIYFTGVGALKAYIEYHENENIKLSDRVNKLIKLIDKEDFKENICNNVGVYDYVEIENSSNFFSDFAMSRSSCRNFNNKSIDKETIREIMGVTIKTPSVCNRQHWKIHIYQNDKIKEILKLQNGNLGFTDNIPYLAVVTSDIRAFYLPNERNQSFVDGGMFSMSFIYALHSHGISSCALNWCCSVANNEKLYQITDIPKNENVMMVIAFGYAERNAKIAKSPRMPVDSFYHLYT